MNGYDPQKAARVWQRVQGQQEALKQTDPDDNLRELIMNEWIAASTYLKLARQMGAKEAAILQRLGREEQTHAACLKGIHTLMTGEKAGVQAPRTETEAPELTLRRCYAGEMRSLKAYEARSNDPEYGHVFASLAQQEREHCRAVLELIGGLGKK